MYRQMERYRLVGSGQRHGWTGDTLRQLRLALAVDSAGPTVYAGGTFWEAGGVSANNIAQWDGTAWSPLGSGIGDGDRDLALDSAGNLYAGANSVAKWDGTASSWAAA